MDGDLTGDLMLVRETCTRIMVWVQSLTCSKVSTRFDSIRTDGLTKQV